MMQMRAMKEGSQFAEALGDMESSTKYTGVSKAMDLELDKFWDDERGYLLATLQRQLSFSKLCPPSADTSAPQLCTNTAKYPAWTLP